jgi:hypothetical protein
MLKKQRAVRKESPAAQSASRRIVEESDSLESHVVGLAMSGKIGKAAKRAVRAQQRLGLAVTYKRGDRIIKRHADGREEVLGTVQRANYTLPKGVRVIK